MSFWTTSDNDDVTKTDGSFDAGGGNFDPIPDGTSVMAMPDEARWQETRDRDAEFVSIRWTVIAPEEYKNRKIFQKLFVSDEDPNERDATKRTRKTDKAKRMLAAIDSNAGGKLMKNARKPTDEDLAVALIGKQMVLRLGVWEMNDNSGNWVQQVAPKSKGISASSSAPRGNGGPTVRRNEGPSFDNDLDDEVPFIRMDGMF